MTRVRGLTLPTEEKLDQLASELNLTLSADIQQVLLDLNEEEFGALKTKAPEIVHNLMEKAYGKLIYRWRRQRC